RGQEPVALLQPPAPRVQRLQRFASRERAHRGVGVCRQTRADQAANRASSDGADLHVASRDRLCAGWSQPATLIEWTMASNIVLVGSTGNIGRCILAEALSRGHRVTAVTRDAGKLSARSGMTVKQGNTADIGALSAILGGHDVAVVSVKWNENDIGHVVEAIRRSAVPRALFVVGAGSLLRADG